LTVGAGDAGVLGRYFALLDDRRVDELVKLFAEDGVMITRGGTEGRAVQGRSDLRDYYLGRGPSTVTHVVTASSESPQVSLAEGIVYPRGDGEQKFFMASASLDRHGRITRYTTLVWPGITEEQAGFLARAAEGRCDG
jgi:SnoaL-like domain